MLKKFLFLSIPLFLFIGCVTTTVSTKPALDINGSSSKIDVYVDQLKEDNNKQILIEEQNKTYTDKIKDLADEAIASNEYWINEAKKEGISIGYDQGVEDQKTKDNSIITQLENALKERGVEINYVEKE